MFALLSALSILFAAGVRLAEEGYARIPPNWMPWGEIALEEKPTLFAKWQLARLEQRPDACFAALDRSLLRYRQRPDRPLRDGCGILARVEVERSQIPYSSGFDAPCVLAATLYWYERRLQVTARELLGAEIARVDHFGTYACRNIYHRAEARRSAHAQARAIDLAGFRLSDGRQVSVSRDWGRDSDAGRFLAQARDEACRLFGVVLSPDYNAAHADHLHLEVGRGWVCR